MLASLGLRRPDDPPLLHHAEPLEVVGSWPMRLRDR